MSKWDIEIIFPDNLKVPAKIERVTETILDGQLGIVTEVEGREFKTLMNHLNQVHQITIKHDLFVADGFFSLFKDIRKHPGKETIRMKFEVNDKSLVGSLVVAIRDM